MFARKTYSVAHSEGICQVGCPPPQHNKDTGAVHDLLRHRSRLLEFPASGSVSHCPSVARCAEMNHLQNLPPFADWSHGPCWRKQLIRQRELLREVSQLSKVPFSAKRRCFDCKLQASATISAHDLQWQLRNRKFSLKTSRHALPILLIVPSTSCRPHPIRSTQPDSLTSVWSWDGITFKGCIWSKNGFKAQERLVFHGGTTCRWTNPVKWCKMCIQNFAICNPWFFPVMDQLSIKPWTNSDVSGPCDSTPEEVVLSNFRDHQRCAPHRIIV